MAAEDFIITRKRKKYKFARFKEFDNCFEAAEWPESAAARAFAQAPRRVIEVGAGTGVFLVEQAQRRPDAFHLALDVKADRLYQGARRALEAGLTNIAFVRAHAEQLVEVLGEGTVDELWLTFSDPFPKKRHAKHRMTHPRFLSVFQRLLQPGGVLHLKTDNHALFDWSLEQLVAHGAVLTNLTYDLHASRLDERYKIMTTYEARFHDAGLAICAVDAVFSASRR